MKKIILLYFISSFLFLRAQDINIGSQAVSLFNCSTGGSLYDSGGSTGDYTSGESFVLTICPDPTLPPVIPIAFEYVSSNFGHANDFMAIYDGANTVNSADLIYSFSQTSSQNVGDIYRTSSSNVSGCITVQFISDVLSLGGNIEFSLLCLPPCKSVVANTPVTSIPVQTTEPSYIHSCLTDPIVFSGSGTYDPNPAGYTQSDASSSFYWDFGASGLDTGQVVSQSFEPGIYPVKLIIEDAVGCFSFNEINLSVRQALIPDVNFIPADTTVCLDGELDLSVFIVSTSDEILHIGDTLVFDTLQVQNSVVVQDTSFLPDDSDGTSGNDTTTPAIFEFPIYGYQPGATLSNVNDLLFVCIDIEHSFVGDLDIILECPNGQSVTLVDFSPPGTPPWSFGEPDYSLGVQGVPYTYCWSPFANPEDSIAEGNFLSINNHLIGPTSEAVDTSILYNATSNAWSNLIGCPLNGDWTIQVFDDYGGDDGFVFGASIEFDGSFALNPDTFIVSYLNASWDANAQIVTALDNDSIRIQTIFNPFQTLSFNFEDNLGCSWSNDYDGITVSTIEVNSFFEDTAICSPDTLLIYAEADNGISSCDYSIEMFDLFGDGWNGNFVNVYLDGVLLGAFEVDASESSYSLETISVSNGQVLSFEYDNSSGMYSHEVRFNVLNSEANVIFSSGLDPQPGVLFSTNVSCNGTTTFDWSPSSEIVSTNDNEAIIYPTTGTVYTVVATNEFGCKDTAMSTVSFDFSNSPMMDLSTIPVEFCCTGTDLNLDLSDYVSGPTISEYSANGVSGNNVSISSSDFAGDSSLTYVFSAEAQNGCSVTDSIDLFIHCINPSIEVVDTIFVGDSKVFNVLTENQYDSMTYVWSTSDVSPNAITDPNLQSAEFNGVFEDNYSASATVTAFFIQNDGEVLACPEDAEAKIYEVVDVLDLRYPNAFSPNGDEINNVFKPIMSEYAEIIDFRVYNRWGDMVYDITKSDNKEGWDGTFNGKDQLSGVYMYFITVKNFNEIISNEGSLNLIR